MLEYSNEDEAQLVKTLITGGTTRLSIISNEDKNLLEFKLPAETNGSGSGVTGFGSGSAAAPPPHRVYLNVKSGKDQKKCQNK